MRIAAVAAIMMATMTPTILAAQAAPAPVAAATGHYSVEDTDLGTLLDDPAAKAVIDKDLPGFSANPQIDMARSLTLRALQGYAPDQVPEKALVAVQDDLNKLPAKK